MRVARLGLALVAALAFGAARADLVALDVDPAIVTAGAVAMDARYRLSQTNWDQMIASSTMISGSTIVAQAQLGNAYTLNNRVWDFSMAYTAGSGYEFTMTDTSVPPLGTSPSTLSWAAPHHGVAATRSFNAIEIFAQARNTLRPGVTAQSINLSNLAFSGAGLATSGSLSAMADSHLALPTLGLDYDQQWLVADTDLSLFSWVLSGRVQAGFTGTVASNFDEQIKFDIKTLQASVVPLPPALGLFAAGLVFLGGVARRQRVGPASHSIASL